MDIRITFRNLEHTPALDSRIRKKTQRLDKFLEGRSSVMWICFTDGIKHFAEIVMEGPLFRLNAKANDKNLYHALDKVINKIEIQLKKHKERWKNPIHQNHPDIKFLKGREEALDDIQERNRLKKMRNKAA